FAQVNGRWVECISEHYARFQGRSEREVQLATAELRQRHRRHGQHFVVTVAKLADFLISLEAEEVLLEQRRRDEEGRQVFALMEGVAGRGLPPPLDHTKEEQQERPAHDISVASLSETSHQEKDAGGDSDALYED